MKKQTLFYLLVLSFVPLWIQAQNSNWRTASLSANSNYFDITKRNNSIIRKNAKQKNNRKSRKQAKQFGRWTNYWKNHILPDGSFVSSTYKYQEWLKENERHRNVLNKNVAEVKWSSLGPHSPPESSVDYYTGMGRLNAVAFHGSDTNTIYVGSPAGGIWKTTDGGKTWSPKGDFLGNSAVSHIVIHPTNKNIVYFASGDWDGKNNHSIGVFKSTDAGETWNPTGLRFGVTEKKLISKLLIDPNNPETIFATTKGSIEKSTDGGMSWDPVFNPDTSSLYNDIQYKTGSSNTIYVTNNRGEFIVSKDNGNTWKIVAKPGQGRLDIAQSDNDPNLILSLDFTGAINKSVDGGNTWTELSYINQFDSQSEFNMTIAISPIDKNLVIVGGVEGWRSRDGGKTWHHYLNGYWVKGLPYFYVHSDHHDMVFIPNSNILFSANDGGLFKGDASTDVKWEDLSSGLAITQYYSVSGTPQNHNKLIMGAQDNDIAVYNEKKFKGEFPGMDGVNGAWDYTNPDIAWICAQEGRIKRTLDGFKTTEDLYIPSSAPFVWDLEIHPTDPKTLYGGFFDIYKSTDRGDNWERLNTGLDSESSAQGISSISISPSNPNVLYASSKQKNSIIKKSSDGGENWESINLPFWGYIRSIEVHPTNPSEIYITYGGYNDDEHLGQKVFRSTNSGKDWNNLTGSLPNIPIHKILYKTGTNDDELFLATDLGVYYRTGTSNDWFRLGKGLPNVIVNDMEIHYGNNVLRIATFGRGVWELPISSLPLTAPINKLTDDSLIIGPNPTYNKTFTLTYANLIGKKNILIYNIIGGVIKNMDTTDNYSTINLESCSEGIYLVKVTFEGSSITKRVVLK